ncbi:MAG: LysM peptidoglycan-binding domain-containing protein [Microscillaceae bacterium]|nr:LysM peptidoglycan-binding domain-containing protein [Microscillaceae bacterium]
MKLVKLFSCLLIGSIFFFPTNSFAQKLRIESQDGQKYIIHKVQSKETVYSISKTYDVEQSEITRLNPSVAQVLKVGEEIRIPYAPDVNVPKLTSSSEEEDKKHIVQKGEWLSQIARKYEVSLEELKEWNKLEEETLKPGQELIVGVASSKTTKKTTPNNKTTVAKNTGTTSPNKTNQDSKITLKTGLTKEIIHTVEKGQSLASLKRDYGVSMAEIREWNNLEEDAVLKIGQKIVIRQNPDQTDTNNNNTAVANNTNTNPKTFSGNNTNNIPNTNTNTGNTADPFGALNNTGGNTTNTTNTDNPFATLGNTNTTTSTPNNTVLTQGQVQNTGQYSRPITHNVQQGETIDRIVNKYNVARSDIRFWNDLPNDNLRIDQPLKIYLPYKAFHQVKQAETKESIANFYKVQPIQIEIWNNLRTPTGPLPISVGQNLVLYLPTGPRPNGLPSPPDVGQYNSNNNQFVNTNTQAQNQNTWTNNTNNDPFGNNQNQNTFNNNNTYPNYTQGTTTTAQPQYHTVSNNETLADLGRFYRVDPNKIVEWNNLGTNYALSPGQRLLIYAENPNGLNRGGNTNFNNNTSTPNTNNPFNNPYNGTPYNTTNPYDQGAYPGTSFNNNNTINNTKTTNFGSQTDPGYNNNSNVFRGSNNNATDYQSVTGGNTYNNSKPVTESGFGEVIRNIQDPKPFVALHRSAPVGTLITVKNQANGRTVVVTVLGPLNNADAGTIIQMTEASYIRLGAIQSKFPVELYYTSK